MAGSDPRFNATKFRDAVRFVMGMGAPVDTAERLTFKWRPQRTFSSATDPSGSPYDWTSSPTSDSTPSDVQVDAAISFSGAGVGSDTDTSLGEFNEVKATITLLDDDYAKVEGADLVEYGGDTYEIDYVIPQGLFDVTVYQVFVTALDES